MKILYTGGGTLGSVSPLIAIHQNLKTYHLKPNTYEALWIGTKKGPERKIVEQEGIEFKPIVAGKLRRYFDLRNILDLFKTKIAWHQALWIIKKFKPDVIVSAGSFVAVPVVWAGWFLRVPCIVHQQDIQPGLANKLMVPFAKKITLALDKSLNDYPQKKAVLVGNPIRTQNTNNRTQKMNFKNNLPTLLVVGGGTGALAINKLIWKSLNELTKFCNVIHITGKGKGAPNARRPVRRSLNEGGGVLAEAKNYKSYEFLKDEMIDAVRAADMVISRAGMSFLTELAYFKKPTIIIPIPNSHQEKNAEYFVEKNAGIYLKQKELSSENLVDEIKKLLNNKDKMKNLGENMNKLFSDYSGKKFLNLILNIVHFAYEVKQTKNPAKVEYS